MTIRTFSFKTLFRKVQRNVCLSTKSNVDTLKPGSIMYNQVLDKMVKEVYINIGHLEDKPVLVLEATPETQASFVHQALQDDAVGVLEDPYGIVTWPSSIGVAKLLLERDLSNHTIVELGCGVGLLSLALALYGNQNHVLATDYNDFAIKSVIKAWNMQRGNIPADKLSTSHFDLNSSYPVPPGTLYVLADVLYNPPLGRIVASRIAEIVRNGGSVVLGDSPGRTGRATLIKELQEHYQDVTYKSLVTQVQIKQGYRHDLISKSSNTNRNVDITIFQFPPCH